MQHVTIQVFGRVQGVFFRASTRDVARQWGILGQVKNLPDGTVLIEAEGSRQLINQLIRWCRNGGPPRGRVERLEVSEGKWQGYTGFDIVH